MVPRSSKPTIPSVEDTSSRPQGSPAQAGNGKPKLERDAAGSIFTDLPPAAAARTVSAVLGEIVWLLTQSAQHKQAFFLGDLEWMAMAHTLAFPRNASHQTLT